MVAAGAGGCAYQPLVVLCPPLTPLVRLIASVFPDAKLREVRALRQFWPSAPALMPQPCACQTAPEHML